MHHRSQHIARPIPYTRRASDESSDPFVNAKHMAFQGSPVGGASNAGPKLLSNNSGQVFERSPREMKLLQRLVRDGIAEGRMESWVSRMYWALPSLFRIERNDRDSSMARVPGTRRWNTTRSRIQRRDQTAVWQSCSANKKRSGVVKTFHGQAATQEWPDQAGRKMRGGRSTHRRANGDLPEVRN